VPASLNDPVRLGQYIRFLRVNSHRTQGELAALCGLTKETIHRTENGEPLKYATLAKIADALGWELIPDFTPVEEDVKVRRIGTGFQPGRDSDAARARMIAYWAQFGACINPFCKALAGMPCKKDHNWTRSKSTSYKACESRPRVKKEEA